MVSQKRLESFTSGGLHRFAGPLLFVEFKTRAERSSWGELLSRSFFSLFSPTEWLIVSNVANERRASLDHVLLSAARARNSGVATPVLSFSYTLLRVTSARSTSYSASEDECDVVRSRVFVGCKWEELTKGKTDQENYFEHARGTVL